MTTWELPVSVEIGGSEYSVCSDYRDILEIIDILQDREKHNSVRILLALSLFYDDFESIPQEFHECALMSMFSFINCGEIDDGRPQPKTIDWKQDGMIIAAEVNKVAGTEVRALSYLHWWTFISYFNGIGEGQLSFIVGIREKIRKGQKLEKHEKEFYQANRSKVDFRQTLTTSEKEVLNHWIN